MAEKSFIFPRGFASLFSVGRALAQVIPTGVDTVIQWDLQTYDLLNEVAIVAPWTFVPQQTGYYYFYASARMNALAVGDMFYMAFRLNGVLSMSTRVNYASMAVQDVSLNIAALDYIRPVDAVDVVVHHNFGANRNLAGAWPETLFFGYRVR